jgi:UDP-N-acetylglucosamine 2-epimerase (non-hydrolysing)
MQEETTYLGVPCLTLRPNTERPITITEGTNELTDLSEIGRQSAKILAGQWKRGRVPQGWDGRAAERIADVVVSHLCREPACVA